jgi:hypothetical protein
MSNSAEFLAEYRKMAEGGSQFLGLSVLQHRDSIRKLARQVDAKSMLDWGCGRGDAYRSPNKLHHQLGISRKDVFLYDPSFPQHDRKPTGKYDLVLCSDVLEHIVEADVDVFIDTLFSHAKKAVWASVCTRPAKKFFSDGVTNLHCTIKPHEWWQRRMEVACGGLPFVLVETE